MLVCILRLFGWSVTEGEEWEVVGIVDLSEMAGFRAEDGAPAALGVDVL